MLASPLGRYVHDRTLEDLQQRLLHAFARHVPRDGRVIPFARDLVDLVDENDPAFGQRHVVVGHLQQPRQDALHVFADISRLGQHRRIDDRKRHFEQFGDRPGQQRLPGTGLPDHHNIRLVDLDLHVVALLVQQPLVMIIDRHRYMPLGALLPDHILIEKLFDLNRFQKLLHADGRRLAHRLFGVLGQQRMPALDALVADAGSVVAVEQHSHLVTRKPAERTMIRRPFRILFLHFLFKNIRAMRKFVYSLDCSRFPFRRPISSGPTALRRSDRISALRERSSSNRGRHPSRSF